MKNVNPKFRYCESLEKHGEPKDESETTESRLDELKKQKDAEWIAYVEVRQQEIERTMPKESLGSTREKRIDW